LTVAAQYKGGNVQFIDLVEEKQLVSLQCNREPLATGSFSFAKLAVFEKAESSKFGSDCFVIPGDDPNEVKVWSASQKNCLLTFSTSYNFGKTQLGDCNSVRTFHDAESGRDLILTGTEDGSLSVWDPAFTRSPRGTVKLHNHPLLDFELIRDSLDDRSVESALVGISGSSGKSMCSFDIDFRTDTIVKRKRILQQFAGVNQFASTRNCSFVAVGTWSHAYAYPLFSSLLNNCLQLVLSCLIGELCSRCLV
jgi:WD40 repeat protein